MRAPKAGEKPRALVLDAGAILQGLNLEASACTTTPSVLREIEEKGATGRRSGFLEAAGLRIEEPSQESHRRVETAARSDGSLARLSATDRDVLALALDLGGQLLTDDYTVQNAAARLGVPFASATTRGIERPANFGARCAGCGRSYDADRVGTICTVCGSTIRSKRIR